MKGVILAGGSGTRLGPLTVGLSKQLLPVYDKPMIYYPLSVLMLAGVREVLIITTEDDAPRFRHLLGNGARLGMRIAYTVQHQPNGLAEALILGRDFIGEDDVTLILGDNIFYGDGFKEQLVKATAPQIDGATVFAYRVNQPERYGVIELDDSGRPLGIEEKPLKPNSNRAVTGLYIYDNRVLEMAQDVRPSKRGELEITDINRMYLELGELDVIDLGRGTAWLDMGTPQSLLEAGEFVASLQRRQARRLACLEEIAFDNGWIDAEGVRAASKKMGKSDYGRYLASLLDAD